MLAIGSSTTSSSSPFCSGGVAGEEGNGDGDEVDVDVGVGVGDGDVDEVSLLVPSLRSSPASSSSPSVARSIRRLFLGRFSQRLIRSGVQLITRPMRRALSARGLHAVS